MAYMNMNTLQKTSHKINKMQRHEFTYYVHNNELLYPFSSVTTYYMLQEKQTTECPVMIQNIIKMNITILEDNN